MAKSGRDRLAQQAPTACTAVEAGARPRQPGKQFARMREPEAEMRYSICNGKDVLIQCKQPSM